MKRLLSSYLLIASYLLAGCQTSSNTDHADMDSEQAEVKLEQIHPGNKRSTEYTQEDIEELREAYGNRNQTKKIIVINSQEQYEEALAKQSPIEEAQEIDFEVHQILFVSWGEKSSGGYGISINEGKTVESKYTINIGITLHAPGENCIVTASLTYPYAFYLVPSKKGIVLQEELVIRNCEPSF